MPKLLTPAQVAELLSIDARTCRRWLREGRFGPDAVVRLNHSPRGPVRVKAEAIDKFIAERTAPAVEARS